MIKRISFFLILWFSFTVQAALIEIDLYSSGDALLTRDTRTGLEWLDISQTVGMSYGEVLTSNYVSNMSFRYANQQELISLYDNAGGSGDYFIPRSSNGNYNGVPVAENYNAAMVLLNLMGCTSYIVGQECDYNDQDWHIGMYGSQVTDGVQLASTVTAYNNLPPYGNAGAIWLDHSEASPERITDDYGSYLVRTSPVPIPATAWLFTSGLISLIGFSKRKKSG